MGECSEAQNKSKKISGSPDFILFAEWAYTRIWQMIRELKDQIDLMISLI